MEKEETCLLLIDPKHFPGKLWNLVNDPQIYSVCWDASGEGILIHQLPFKTEVLLAQTTQISKYFRTTDFASFIRQLNLYGFRKVPPDPPEKLHDNFSNLTQTHHFHNQNFKRDKPELLLHIKRLTAANKSKLAAGKQLPCKSSHSFYNAMPNLPLKISAVTKDSASVGHQGTFYHLSCNDLKQVKECDSTPKSPQRPAMNYGDSSAVNLYSNKDAPCSVFHHFPTYLSYTHPSNPVHMQHGIMSHYAQNRFYSTGLLSR
ncbi:heat shock factor protein 5 isoform X3 [Silurus meridionalis]|uniref:heat shock factor protein 5 isoform X3 n=1 Tax=Silurus meridionalis TaxID=175797 RepID=UPI001EEC3AE6|nr:heat shock factor protein 5 isoform X3 [Silurus meridionalis]